MGLRKRSDWKPFSIRTPFLTGVIVISLLLAGTLQYLLVRSTRDNGLFFAADLQNLSLLQKFTYLHLLTVVSVLYAFLWTWIDLDVRRLEPFFQLHAGHVSGKKSLLLDYPVGFIASVPFQALKNR